MNQFTPVLHSVSYASAWPGHSFLDVDAFLNKAVELGYRSIALVAKRPHVSPLDYDEAARRKLRTRIEELGLELAAMMGYSDFTAGLEHPGIPSAEMNAAYVGVVAKLAADLGTNACVSSRATANQSWATTRNTAKWSRDSVSRHAKPHVTASRWSCRITMTSRLIISIRMAAR